MKSDKRKPPKLKAFFSYEKTQEKETITDIEILSKFMKLALVKA